MQSLNISTSSRNELIDITHQIEDNLSIENGIVLIHIPHTTAGITINENADPDVKDDILKKLSSLIPKNDNYNHAEGNSDAHLKASLIGNNTTVMIKNKKIQLGTWQSIFFCEFDGPRQRKIWTKEIE